MKIKHHIISNDRKTYEAWPDLALTQSGKLICVFAECTHHLSRSYTRVMISESFDKGKNWLPKRPLTEVAGNEMDYYYNCARISCLKNNQLAIVVDRIYGKDENRSDCRVVLYTSDDEGLTWTKGVETPARGIVPDKLCEVKNGRWLLAVHMMDQKLKRLVQNLWYSDDKGLSWQGPVTVGKDKYLNLCEASILPVGSALVAFMRENSFEGKDCFKAISHDNGESWSAPIAFPLPGCHRPVAGMLKDGRIMLTYRFAQGGHGKWGGFQNFFGAITDVKSALSLSRREASTRIFPLDHDFSPRSDTGYSGWVQMKDGSIYIVNYIMENNSKAYIKGYSLKMPLKARKKEEMFEL